MDLDLKEIGMSVGVEHAGWIDLDGDKVKDLHENMNRLQLCLG